MSRPWIYQQAWSWMLLAQVLQKTVLFKIWYKETAQRDFCALKEALLHLCIFMSNLCLSRWVVRGFSQLLSFWSLHHSDHSIGRIGFQSLVRRGTVVSVGLRRFVRFVSCYLFVVFAWKGMKRSKIFWKESSSGTSTKLIQIADLTCLERCFWKHSLPFVFVRKFRSSQSSPQVHGLLV